MRKKTQNKILPDFHPMVWILLVTTGLIRIASSMSAPFIAIFLTTRMNTGLFEAGMSLTAAALASMFAGFFVGNLSDRFGRKLTILGSLTMSAILLSMFAIGGIYGSTKTIALFFSIINFLFNIARRSFDPVAQACMAELSTENMKVTVFSWRYFFINVGSSIGPAVGAVLGFSGSIAAFVVASVIYAIIAFILYLYFHRYPLPTILNGSVRVSIHDALRLLRKDKNIIVYILALAFVMVGYSQVGSGLVYILVQNGDNQKNLFAMLLTMNGLLIVFFQIPISSFLQKRRVFLWMTFGAILMSIGVFFWGIASKSLTLYIGGMVFCTFGEICIFPLSSYWIDTMAPSQYRATWFGAAGFCQIGACVAPLLSGYLLERWSPTISMSIISLIILFSIPFFQIANNQIHIGQVKTRENA